MSYDLKVKYELLESARTTMAITSERLHKRSVVIKQICKLFPQRRVNIDGERKDGSSGQYDQICNARLPRGLDSHSIPSEVLAASLGYMVQLLNLVVHNVAAPALHNLGFAVINLSIKHTCGNLFSGGVCTCPVPPGTEDVAGQIF
ncbi:uncharacterized protein LOC114260219 isoform X2 [Camellia sinensis]|uniref:uncharacterized protein LOC114260219 isoform X2 n=1 Tax=Camellia sinensis TaxID=4442 RepID=UPI001035786C|nr:uncharacterized protein LOC114260219 isoform X2 [Camellia sinensis]